MILLLFILSACTIDLPVGQVESSDSSDPDAGHPDAIARDASEPDASAADASAMDASAEPRTLSITATPSIMCADSLGGRESDFGSIAPADVGLGGGEITYQLAASMILSGPPIQAAFQTNELVLDEGVVPDQPPGTYLGAVAIEAGAPGPLGTTLVIAAMFVDTLVNPPIGEAGFEFDTANLDGACFVSFPIAIAP